MSEIVKKSATIAFAIITGVFTFVPESFFGKHEWISQEGLEQKEIFSNLDAQDINIVISRLVFLLLVFIVALVGHVIFRKIRKRITIRGENYSIRIEYGNILEMSRCKRVINFDECFTTQVGDKIADINANSICGQYLAAHPNLDLQKLINDANVKPAQTQ